ncbi:hypothetical protein, partial [Trueperella pyogenes]
VWLCFLFASLLGLLMFLAQIYYSKDSVVRGAPILPTRKTCQYFATSCRYFPSCVSFSFNLAYRYAEANK